MDHQFRNAVFGGFNRQDVLDYLETLARENAQKRQELEQSIGRAEGERDELCAQKQALEEQKRALEGEKEELLRSVQRSQSELAALRTQLGEREQTARQTQQALEESRREAEALREQVARLEPDAAAYAAVKDRSAGVELEAHRRAQGVLDQANSQARHLRQQMEQWMTRVGREYDALRTEVEATISHAADQLDKAGKCLEQVSALLSDQDVALEELSRAYDSTAPDKVPAPVPLEEEPRALCRVTLRPAHPSPPAFPWGKVARRMPRRMRGRLFAGPINIGRESLRFAPVRPGH